MNEVSFASPWLLFLLLAAPLLAAPLLAALPYWWRRRLGPAGMRYADNRLVSGNSRSLRLRVMPFVSALRFLALALVIVAAARPQVSDAREVIRGEGGGHCNRPGHLREHGTDGLCAEPAGGGKADCLRIHRRA